MLIRFLAIAVVAGWIPLRSAAAGQTDVHRALLDSLGTCPGSTLVREYVLPDGGVGRQYATPMPMDEAPTTVTVFYRDRLLARSWQEIQRHAAVSIFVKGDRTVAIVRSGPTDSGLPPGARLVKSAPSPADARFFFGIEVEPYPPREAPVSLRPL